MSLYIREDSGSYAPASAEVVRHAAMALAEARMRQGAYTFGSPDECSSWLTARFADLDREEFACIWLDTQNRLIATETLSVGTINAANVYPREVVRSAMKHNAAAVVFAHNHPSGIPEPSNADRTLTDRLRSALALVDVRALDHFVVAGTRSVSFAERGWM